MRQLFKLRPASRRPRDDTATDAAADAPDAENVPFPPRFHWLKRGAAAYVTLLTCLALLYWAWTAYSQRQLAAAIAEIKSRGEPILYEDFDPPPIPDDRNAAVPLKRAAALFQPDNGWTSRLSREAQYNLDNSVRFLRAPADLAQIDTLIDNHVATLRLIRDARARPSADWNLRVRPRIISTLLPDLNGQRDLIQFLATAAVARHSHGDDAEALELCRDMLAIGDHVADNTPFQPATYMGCGAGSRVVDVIEQSAPALNLRNRAARSVADSLIAELLDERRPTANYIRAAEAERTFALDIFSSYIEPTTQLTKPAYRLDAARALRQREREVAAARAASYADVVALVPEHEPPWNGGPSAANASTPRWRVSFWRGYPPRLERQTRVITTMFHNTRRSAEVFYRAQSDRRAAATLLAVRMYQLDHAGALPARWDDLVPAYLPAAPRDPFARNAAQMTLVRRDANNLILYSVAKNLTDDAGSELDYRGQRRYVRDPAVADFVYHYPPASPPNAQ